MYLYANILIFAMLNIHWKPDKAPIFGTVFPPPKRLASKEENIII
jgi:hypothetical protein